MDKKVIVECWKDGECLAAYPFLIPGSLAAPPIWDRAELERQAKDNLTTEGKASPPYQGITCRLVI